MPNNFEFFGKIQAMKPTDSFIPIEVREYNSGWVNHIVRFNCASGTNRIACLVQGGKWKDDSRNSSIKTFSKTTTDVNGNVVKGEKIEIPWSKRFDEKEIARVAGFRKFIVDLGDSKKRYRLQDAIKAFNDGSITEDLMTEIECKSLDEAKAALEKSNQRRHVFLSEYDFAEYMAKVVVSEKIKDSIFRISGVQEVQYSPDKGRFYVNYHVNKVELAKEDVDIDAHMNIDFYFGENCIDDSSFENNKMAIINGFTTYYDSSLKDNGFMPISIVIRDEKNLRGVKRKFVAENDEIKNIGLVVDVINGAEIIGLTYDDLDDETKQDIDDGLLELKDVIAALGGNKIGDRITELRLVGINVHKKTVEDTTYTIADMKPATMKSNIIDDDDDDDIL